MLRKSSLLKCTKTRTEGGEKMRFDKELGDHAARMVTATINAGIISDVKDITRYYREIYTSLYSFFYPQRQGEKHEVIQLTEAPEDED